MKLHRIFRKFTAPLVLALSWGAMLGVASHPAASPTCFHPQGNILFPVYGDANGSGAVNVADVLCTILTSLWQLAPAGDPPPTCLADGNALFADLNCDGGVDVTDASAAVWVALGSGLPDTVDGDGDGCHDGCAACVAPAETSCLLGGACVPEGHPSPDDPCEGCVPSVSASEWTALEDGTPCGPGSQCQGGFCVEAQGGAPSNVFAIPGLSEAVVTFTAPPLGADTPLSYLVTVYSSAGAAPVGVSGPTQRNTFSLDTDFVFTGLSNGIAYRFSVAQITTSGTGPQSALSNIVVPVGPPGEPRAVIATAGDQSAVVSFLPPTSNGGTAITGYEVVVYPLLMTIQVVSSPVLIQGIANGEPVWFTVAAKNIAGTGPVSTPSNVVLPVGLPGAPLIIGAAGQDGQLYLSVAPPANTGGAEVLLYTATCIGFGGAVVLTSSSVELEIIVVGAVNGATYTCVVTATNDAGTGPASGPSAVLTPNGVLQPPGVLVAPPAAVYRSDQYDGLYSLRSAGAVAAPAVPFAAATFDSGRGMGLSGAVVAPTVSAYSAQQYDAAGAYSPERTGAILAPTAAFGGAVFDSGFGTARNGAVVAPTVSAYSAFQYDQAGAYRPERTGVVAAPSAAFGASVFDSGRGIERTGAVVAPAVSAYAADQYDQAGAYVPERTGAVVAPTAAFASGVFDSGLGIARSGAVVAPAVSAYSAEHYDSGGVYAAERVGAVVAPSAVFAAAGFGSGRGVSLTGAVVAPPTASVGKPYIYSVAPVAIARSVGQIEFEITGIGLQWAQDVYLYAPGSSIPSAQLVASTPPAANVQGDSLSVVVDVDPSAATGTWTVAVVTASGISSPIGPPGSQLGFDNTFVVTP